MTKGMSNFKLGEKEVGELIHNLYLQKGNGGISLLLDLIGHAPDMVDEVKGQQCES